MCVYILICKLALVTYIVGMKVHCTIILIILSIVKLLYYACFHSYILRSTSSSVTMIKRVFLSPTATLGSLMFTIMSRYMSVGSTILSSCRSSTTGITSSSDGEMSTVTLVTLMAAVDRHTYVYMYDV